MKEIPRATKKTCESSYEDSSSMGCQLMVRASGNRRGGGAAKPIRGGGLLATESTAKSLQRTGRKKPLPDYTRGVIISAEYETAEHRPCAVPGSRAFLPP